MEHYHKVSSQLIEKSQVPNELRVGPASGRPNVLVEKSISILNEYPSEGLIVSSCGTHVTKAVGVIEQLKKQNDILQDSFDLYYVRVEDIWSPNLPGLDTLKVKRRIPAIQVRLVREPVKRVKPATSQPSSSSAGGKSRRKRREKPKENQ